jgi:Tol biopolymer transport system component
MVNYISNINLNDISTAKIINQVPGSQNCIYPQWTSDGQSLVVDNGSPDAQPNPSTAMFSLSGKILYSNMNGTCQDIPLFGGMPAVNPNNNLYIAFPGQPTAKGFLPDKTTGKTTKSGYNQNYNYIFLNNCDENGVFTSSPMLPGADAHLQKFDQDFMGRAPAWDPTGRFIVFESNRCTNVYCLWLFDTQSQSLVQLTSTDHPAQHAKFFQNGTSLVICACQTGYKQTSIGWIDISEIINGILSEYPDQGKS